MKSDEPNWKQIEWSTFEAIRSIGKLQPLPQEHWVDWSDSNKTITNMYFTDLDREKKGDTDYLSLFDANAEMLMERYDQGTFKYYSYYLITMADERVFQSRPYTSDIPGGHHQLKRPDWLSPI